MVTKALFCLTNLTFEYLNLNTPSVPFLLLFLLCFAVSGRLHSQPVFRIIFYFHFKHMQRPSPRNQIVFLHEILLGLRRENFDNKFLDTFASSRFGPGPVRTQNLKGVEICLSQN